MKSRLAALVAALAVVPVAGVSTAATTTPAPEGFRSSQPLTVRVAKISGDQGAVALCARTAAVWEDFAIGNGWTAGTLGVVVLGEQSAYLAPSVCTALERWLRGKRVTKPALSRGLRVLVHEAIHLRGVRAECATERHTLRELPRWMRTLFGVKRKETQAQLLRLARAESFC